MGSVGPEAISVSKRREVVKRLFGGRGKEQIQEIPLAPEIPEGIEKGQQITGAATPTPPPITDDQTGQTLLGPADPQSPAVVLPLTDDQVEAGLKTKVFDSVRWLAVWCVRLLKKIALGNKE